LPLEVFTQRNFVADFIRLKLEFCLLKNKIIDFWATLWERRSTHSIYSSLEACGGLPIRHDWTFFAISYG